jgi:cell division septum initiation protein DivIVA
MDKEEIQAFIDETSSEIERMKILIGKKRAELQEVRARDVQKIEQLRERITFIRKLLKAAREMKDDPSNAHVLKNGKEQGETDGDHVRATVTFPERTKVRVVYGDS